MSDQSHELPLNDTALAHAESITTTLRELVDYGPVQISTRMPGIPGVEYQEPFRGDENRTPVAYIGSSLLTVEVEGENVNVVVDGADNAEPVVLTPGQIERVSVDHPYSKSMPLLGCKLLAVSLTDYNGLSVLRWPNNVIEVGWHDRIDRFTHPQYSGIAVVKAYRADIDWKNPDAEGLTLDEAKANDEEPRTFLITRIDEETHLVTSRLGYENAEPKPVTVRKPKHPPKERLLHIEMLDLHKDTTDEELVDLHIKRYRELSPDSFGTPRRSMDPFDVDKVFLYMVND
jgi:hypothetical protein